MWRWKPNLTVEVSAHDVNSYQDCDVILIDARKLESSEIWPGIHRELVDRRIRCDVESFHCVGVTNGEFFLSIPCAEFKIDRVRVDFFGSSIVFTRSLVVDLPRPSLVLATS